MSVFSNRGDTTNVEIWRSAMKLFSTLLAALVMLSACSPATQIRLGSDAEYLPKPMFTVTSPANDRSAPSYSRLKVYEVSDGCSIPNCPLMWNVEVSPRQSPDIFHYGKPMGLGTITLTPAKPLVTERDYKVVLVESEYYPTDFEGELNFRVSPDGQIVTVSEKD